jgi:hypothetical protein
LGMWFRCVVPKRSAHNKVANITYLYPISTKVTLFPLPHRANSEPQTHRVGAQ